MAEPKISKLRLLFPSLIGHSPAFSCSTMEPPKCLVYLRECKDACNALVAVLCKHRKDDCFELLPSAARCNKLLLECVSSCELSAVPNEVPESIWGLSVVFKNTIKVGRKGASEALAHRFHSLSNLPLLVLEETVLFLL